MPIYRPKELISFLQEHSLKPLKCFSQNFLIDGNIVRKIADMAQITPGDFVIEIGPGPGALTEEILQRNAKLLAIEMDRGFAKHLERFHDLGDLTIITADALTCDFKDLLLMAGNAPVKIVGNLPYHISTPLLAKVLPLHEQIQSYTVMVQKEFAKRMVALCGEENYSSFSIFLSLFVKPGATFDVKPGSFIPRPKVDSTVVHLISQREAIKNPEQITTLTRTAFSQRRKKLTTSLAKILPKSDIIHVLQNLQLSLDVRPEELSLALWQKLAEQFFVQDNSYAQPHEYQEHYT